MDEDLKEKLKILKNDNVKLSKHFKLKMDEINQLNISLNAVKTELQGEKMLREQCEIRVKQAEAEVQAFREASAQSSVSFNEASEIRLKALEQERINHDLSQRAEKLQEIADSSSSALAILRNDHAVLTKNLQETSERLKKLEDESKAFKAQAQKEKEERDLELEDVKKRLKEEEDNRSNLQTQVSRLKEKEKAYENEQKQRMAEIHGLQRMSVTGMSSKDREEMTRALLRIRDLEARLLASEKAKEEQGEAANAAIAKLKEVYKEKVEKRNETIKKLTEKINSLDEVRKNDLKEMAAKFDEHAKILVERSHGNVGGLRGEYEEKLQKMREETANLKKTLEEREKMIYSLREKMLDQDVEFNKKVSELSSKLKDQFHSALEQALKAQFEGFEQNKKQLEQIIEEKSENESELEKRISQMEQDNLKLIQIVQQQKKLIVDLEEKLRKAEDEVTSVSLECEEIKSQLENQIKETNIKYLEEIHSRESIMGTLRENLENERMSVINYKEIERAYTEMQRQMDELKADNQKMAIQLRKQNQKE